MNFRGAGEPGPAHPPDQTAARGEDGTNRRAELGEGTGRTSAREWHRGSCGGRRVRFCLLVAPHTGAERWRSPAGVLVLVVLQN